MSLTQTPEETAQGVAEMKAMSAQRIAALNAPKSPAKPEAAPKGSVEVGKPVDDSAAKESVGGGQPAKAGSPPKAPDAVAVADYSFVPELLRPEAEKLSKSFLAHLKDQAERDKNTTTDYHAKTTALAADRAALEAKKALLEFGESVHDDPEAFAMLKALHEKRMGRAAPATDAEPFKYTAPHTDEEWEAHFEERDKRTYEKAVRDVEGRFRSAESVKTEKATIARNVLDTLTKEERTVEEVNSLFIELGDWDGMRALLKAKGKEFSAENVVDTLRKFLPAKAAKPAEATPTPDSTNGHEANGHGSNGASALGRNSGVGAPLRVPKFMLDGKQPSDRSQRLEAALMKVNERRISQGLPPFTND